MCRACSHGLPSIWDDLGLFHCIGKALMQQQLLLNTLKVVSCCLILEDLLALSTVLAFLGNWFREGFWKQVARPLDTQGFGDTLLGDVSRGLFSTAVLGELR